MQHATSEDQPPVVRVYNVWYQVGRFWPWGPLGVGMDLEKAIDQCCLRSAVLGEEVGDLKFVAAAVSGCLPFIADEQAPRGRIEHQMPAIHISGRRRLQQNTRDLRTLI